MKRQSSQTEDLTLEPVSMPDAGINVSDDIAGSLCRFDPLAPTIFHEEWWLDAATGGGFEVAVVSSGGRTVGRLPFYLTRRLGMKMIRMPELTYFLGPAIDEGQGTVNTRFLNRLAITRELIQKLPSVAWEYIKCHGGVTDVIAFQEMGFRTYVQFTNQVSPKPIEVLWQRMRNKTRNVIRKAEERFSVAELSDPDEFIRLYERNLQAKGLQNGLDGAICKRILAAALIKQRGKILVARDQDDQIVAATFCAWDAVTSFYLLSTRCDGSGNSASSLLIWEAIKQSARSGLVFDFAGLGSRGSVLLYSGFGGVISVRYIAVRANPIARILAELKGLLARQNCFY